MQKNIHWTVFRHSSLPSNDAPKLFTLQFTLPPFLEHNAFKPLPQNPIYFLRLLPQRPMSRPDLFPRQPRNPLPHLRRHVRLQRLILRREHKQHLLFDFRALPYFSPLQHLGKEILQFIHIIHLAIPIPIKRPMEAMSRIFRRIILQLILTQKLRRANLGQILQTHAFSRIECDFAVRPGPAVHGIEELFDLRFRLDGFFELARGEMLLVAEVGQAFVDEDVQRLVDGGGREIGRADAEEVGDEVRVVLGEAVDDCAAPAGCNVNK